MDCLTLKNHLLPHAYDVTLIPALSFLSALLPSLCSSFILPALSLSPLYSSLHLFTMMHSLSLSLSTVLCPSFLPSLLSKDGLSFCLFIILFPFLHPQHTHTRLFSKSLCLSDFLHLQFLSALLASPCPSSPRTV